MVHLVIVSHSRQIAEGVALLARQMAPEELTISAVGGMDDAEGEALLGTDPLQIAAMLQAHTGPEGALILVDLGSSVLSAEAALEMVEPALRKRCRISNAPLVEGAVIAAVEAGLHHSLEAVNQAAEAVAAIPKVMRAE
jgi:dihydroxyacetone kinase phosphotransfer subunit